MRSPKRPRQHEALTGRTRRYLIRKTREARAIAPHASWIQRAWKSFLRTVARRNVDEALDSYSHRKCAYCEQVDARDIEHFMPKSVYPSRMFRWGNFLRACST